MKREKPVITGDKITIKIENIGSKGDGIARKEDFVIITPNTQPRKTYTVEIKRVYKNFAIANKIREETTK